MPGMIVADFLNRLRQARRDGEGMTLAQDEIARLEAAGVFEIIEAFAIDDLVDEPELFRSDENAHEVPTIVYFIQDAAGFVKIGRTASPEQRLRYLQHAHAQPLRLLATVDAACWYEGYLHGHFHPERMLGEWFRPSARLLAFVEKMQVSEP